MGLPTEPFHEIGAHAEIDADVVLGYRYPGDSQPTRIGDHAIIRSGSIVYANTTIGHSTSNLRLQTSLKECPVLNTTVSKR